MTRTTLADTGFLILRLGVTGMLATFHGWDKFRSAIGYIFQGQEWGFAGFLGGMGFPLPTFFALCAALAEFVGCLLLAVGAIYALRSGTRRHHHVSSGFSPLKN